MGNCSDCQAATRLVDVNDGYRVFGALFANDRHRRSTDIAGPDAKNVGHQWFLPITCSGGEFPSFEALRRGDFNLFRGPRRIQRPRP